MWKSCIQNIHMVFKFLLEYSCFIVFFYFIIVPTAKSTSYTYAHIPSFLDFLPLQVTAEIEQRAPCAIWQVLMTYLFYTFSIFWSKIVFACSFSQLLLGIFQCFSATTPENTVNVFIFTVIFLQLSFYIVKSSQILYFFKVQQLVIPCVI